MSGDGFFKRTMILMTLVWGVGLLAEAGLSAVLVFALPVATYLAIAPVVGYATMGGLGLWTVWYRARRRKMGKILRAQAAQASTS